jgi:hypothetical protein
MKPFYIITVHEVSMLDGPNVKTESYGVTEAIALPTRALLEKASNQAPSHCALFDDPQTLKMIQELAQRGDDENLD